MKVARGGAQRNPGLASPYTVAAPQGLPEKIAVLAGIAILLLPS